MKYEIGEDGILRQVDDGTPAPAPIKPATTTPLPHTNTAAATTSSTGSSTTTTTSSARPATTRRRVDYANVLHVASWALIIAGIVAAGVLAYFNYEAYDVGIGDYLERVWWHIKIAWQYVDPFYGFSVVVDPSLSIQDIIDIMDEIVLGGGWIILLRSGIEWLISTALPLVQLIVQSWTMLLKLLFDSTSGIFH